MELKTVSTNKTKKAIDSPIVLNHLCRDIYYTKATEETNNISEEILLDIFKKRVHEKPNFTVFKSKSNPKVNGFDISTSMTEYFDLTKRATRSFIKIGLEVKGAVGIIGFNHVAWAISQFGCIFAGGMACGIYSTNTAELCKFIMNDCNCQVIVLENDHQLTKILSIVTGCPQLKAIIQYTGNVSDERRRETTVPIYTWTEFLGLGSEDQEQEMNTRVANIRPRDVAVLIYTSGTTGLPKGVMLSHDNVIWTSKMIIDTINLKPYVHSVVSYLPFSHIAANLFDLIGTVTLGTTLHFAQPDALKGSLNKTMVEVRPTIFLAVPRVFEKMQEAMQDAALKFSCFQRHVSKWAKQVGFRNSVAKQAGKSPDLSFQIANCLVFSKVKKLLGLDQCTYLVSGAAPICQQTLEFFQSLDILIHQVYGMSESTGPHTIGRIGNNKAGTTGSLMKGAEMKIADPDENGVGEICMKGRHVFLGYYRNPEKTNEVLDKDGWLHSGDIGKVVDNEFLVITGRIKELIITAGGENIAPVPIEQKIMEKLPFVGYAMLVGDQKKFVSCLLTIKTVVDYETQMPTDKLTPGSANSLHLMGIEATNIEDVIGAVDSTLRTKIDEVIKEVNSTSVSNASIVQKWSFLPRDFSIPGGELGPTMKMKRSVIVDMYADIIDRMYLQ